MIYLYRFKCFSTTDVLLESVPALASKSAWSVSLPIPMTSLSLIYMFERSCSYERHVNLQSWAIALRRTRYGSFSLHDIEVKARYWTMGFDLWVTNASTILSSLYGWVANMSGWVLTVILNAFFGWIDIGHRSRHVRYVGEYISIQHFQNSLVVKIELWKLGYMCLSIGCLLGGLLSLLKDTQGFSNWRNS